MTAMAAVAARNNLRTVRFIFFGYLIGAQLFAE
jgi:hypothetical protein